MKISAIPSIGPSSIDASSGAQIPGGMPSIRTLKMSTNVTPGLAMPGTLPLAAPPIEAPQAAVEVTQPLSPQLALLARERRSLQVKQRELAEREKALKSQDTGSAGIPIARLKSEPLSVFEEVGLSYEDLTNAILANQGNSEVNALKAKLDALEKGIDQKFVDREAQAEKQVLAEMQREATQLSRSDDFELVREMRSVPKVMELIKRTYHATGEALDVTEAMTLVEDYLLKDAQRLSKLKKLNIQAVQQSVPQFQQSPALSRDQYQYVRNPQHAGMRTLTNKDTASVPLSAKARALAAFYGTLKK